MKGVVKKLYGIIPQPLKDFQNSLRIKDRLLLRGKKSREARIMRNLIRRVQSGEKINVVFFAMSVSFWKYDELFRLMQQSDLFNPLAVFTPRPIDNSEIQEQHRKKLSEYFKAKGFPFQETLGDFEVHILFYAQPYKNSVCEPLRAYNHLDKLICYVPYAFFISNYKWAYDSLVHNLAWKLFYPTTLHKKNAQEIALNKGENVDVVGYPLADKFMTPASRDPWKIQDRTLKRIVWGVHHSIFSDDLVDCGTFLKFAEPMLQLARNSRDCQFAFKPHPHLKEHLYKHPDWGKDRTDSYYAAWNEAENTFLVDGDYVDLFKTSDALIHDCGSFTVEYLFINRPVLYIGNQRDNILCNFGKKAMEGNYTRSDFTVERFISDAVLPDSAAPAAADTREPLRREILSKYLTPPNGLTFAQNILDILEKEICK